MMVTSAFAALTTTASWVLLYLHPLAIAADYGHGAYEQEEAYRDFKRSCSLVQINGGQDFHWPRGLRLKEGHVPAATTTGQL
jgi:hypothetical protein